MTRVEVENALKYAFDDFGLPYSVSDFSISETESDSSEFERILNLALRKYLRFKRSEDEGFCESVENSQNIWYLTHALEERFAANYSDEFPSFGEFDREAARQQLEGVTGNAYYGMLNIFDQASGHPKAFLAVANFSSLPRFASVDEGLKEAFQIGYQRIVSALKKEGFLTYRRLPPYMPDNFAAQVEEVLSLIQNDEQVRDFKRKTLAIIKVILDPQSEASDDLKELAAKGCEILRRTKRRFTLPFEDKEILLEMLGDAQDLVADYNDSAKRYDAVEIILDKL